MYFTLCCRAWILETEKKSQQCLSAALEAPSCCTGAFMYSHVDLGIHLVQPGIKDLWWFWDIVSIWKVWCGLIPFGSVWQYTDQSFLIGISKSKIRFQRTEVLLRRENGKTAEHAVLIKFQFTVPTSHCNLMRSLHLSLSSHRRQKGRAAAESTSNNHKKSLISSHPFQSAVKMRTLGFLSLTRSFMRSGYSIPFAFRYWLLPWFSSMIMMLWRDLPVSSWTVLSWTWFVSLSYDEECPLPRLFEHRNISWFLVTIRSRLTWNFLMAESGSCCCWTASADWSVTRWLMNQWQQLLVTGGGSIYGLGLERSFVIALLLLLLIGVFFFVVVFFLVVFFLSIWPVRKRKQFQLSSASCSSSSFYFSSFDYH